MVAPVKTPVRMTLNEFLRWDSGDEWRYELVDGEPRVIPLTNVMHGLLHARLCAELGNHLVERAASALVLCNAGIIPRRSADRDFRVADLAVTCSPIRPEEVSVADPVLIAEILSSDDQARTWLNVWAYTSIPTVRDVLILHADRVTADLLKRAPDGEWPDEPTRIDRGAVELESIGLRLALSELYSGTGLSV